MLPPSNSSWKGRSKESMEVQEKPPWQRFHSRGFFNLGIKGVNLLPLGITGILLLSAIGDLNSIMNLLLL